MRLDIDTVPGAHEEPASAEQSAVWAPSEGWSRRKVLAAIGGVTVASGLSVLGLLPWSRPQRAYADAYVSWSTCHGYWDSSTTCVPSTAYYGSNVCSGSWHKDYTDTGSCYYIDYYHNPSSCDGNNAWKWGGSSARGAHRKCSDGWYTYRSCQFPDIDRFSICRTAIA